VKSLLLELQAQMFNFFRRPDRFW